MLLWNKMTDMDEYAFKGFVELYTSDLLYYAQYIVRSKEEAEEIVSDVFVTVWQNRNKIREIEHVKAWLLTIPHTQAVSICARKTMPSPPSHGRKWAKMPFLQTCRPPTNGSSVKKK